jgi:hypothetical protein
MIILVPRKSRNDSFLAPRTWLGFGFTVPSTILFSMQKYIYIYFFKLICVKVQNKMEKND